MSFEALTELKNAIKLDPEFTKAYLALAGIYEVRKDSAKAISTYQEISQKHPENPTAYLRLGVLLNNLDRHTEALGPLRAAWRIDRSNARTASAIGKALQATGALETAELMYEEAIRLDSHLSSPYYDLAVLRFNGARYESAIALFTAYMERAGDSFRALRNIGKAHVHLGNVDAAVQSFTRALTLAPDDATVQYSLARALVLKADYHAAVRRFSRALTIRPEYIEARYHLANCLRKMGKPKEADAQFKQVQEQCPEYCRAMECLGDFGEEGVPTKRLSKVLRTVGIGPDQTEAHYNAGVALQNMNKLEDASYHFRESLRLNPDYKQAKDAVDDVIKRLGLNPQGSDVAPADQKRRFQTA
jgi:tetratricopeptide (TPR) repeat protein